MQTSKIFSQKMKRQPLMPVEFIQKVLINNIGDLVAKEYFWLAFTLMAIGIEFLGKCLDFNQQDWNKGKSKINFEKAINDLQAFNQYKPFLKKYKVWDSYRNGFAHSFVPKKPLGLSSGNNEADHLIEYKDKNGKECLNFKCEDLYIDFKNACNEIIKMEFDSTNKMSRPLLSVPDFL